MKVRPLYDRILVQRMEAQEQVRGGIIIPDTAKEKPMEAKVIAVGEGKNDDNGKRVPLEVKAGDHVLIGKYSGTEIKVDDDGAQYPVTIDPLAEIRKLTASDAAAYDYFGYSVSLSGDGNTALIGAYCKNFSYRGAA